MPIWFELVALALTAYILGLGTGWILWAGEIRPATEAGTTETEGETQTS